MNFENKIIHWPASEPEPEAEELEKQQADIILEQQGIEAAAAAVKRQETAAEDEWKEKLKKLYEENPDDNYHDLGPERRNGNGN